MLNTTYTAVIQEDENNELYIEIPKEVMCQLGWNEYTNLSWNFKDAGQVSIQEEK
jgi:hypothetical protein